MTKVVMVNNLSTDVAIDFQLRHFLKLITFHLVDFNGGLFIMPKSILIVFESKILHQYDIFMTR